jgi:hypothetical protein
VTGARVAVLKLRNHIPIGAPARREPADGNESPLRVSLGFEPAWFTRRCGVDLGADFHRDPRVRHRALERMKRELVRRFPSAVCWGASRTDDLATLSGAYGAYPVPYVFGVPLVYAPDRWPALDPRHRLTPRQMERLEAQAVLQSAGAEELCGQMETIEREWGTIHGYLNWQGVLNNAFNLRGQEIFLDMFDRPELTRHFFSVITEVMVRLARLVQERQRRSGFPIDQLSVSNCVMNMISPRAYEQFVYSFDRRIAGSFARFGVHTCNWDITPYIRVLSRLPNLGYLDMGAMSDLKAVRRAFPDTYRAVLYSPVTLHEAAPETLRADMRRIYREIAPCDLVMADIQASTSDERVRELLAVCRELEAKPPPGRRAGAVRSQAS